MVQEANRVRNTYANQLVGYLIYEENLHCLNCWFELKNLVDLIQLGVYISNMDIILNGIHRKAMTEHRTFFFQLND